MTTFVGGEVVTAAILNAYEDILSAATWTTNRQTFAVNSSYNLASGVVASNLVFNGSVVIGSAKQFEAISFRTLSSTLTGNATATGIYFDHQCNPAAGSTGYGMIGSVTGLSGGAGKISPIYGRAGLDSGFTGTGVGGTFAVTAHDGSTPSATSAVLGLDYSSDGAGVAYPVGVNLASNTPGVGSIGNAFVILDSIQITTSCYQWNQRAGTSAYFLLMYDASSNAQFAVDYLGNMKFLDTQSAAGQRITGDLSNATHTKRLMFKGAAAGNSLLGVVPNGTNTGGFIAYGDTDPDNAPQFGFKSSTSAAIIDSNKLGSGTVQPLSIQTGAATIVYIPANKDLVLGQAAAATGDTTGHHYIQAVAGAPTGVPTGYAGYVAMRYDSTNNFLYVYNGGWKKSTVYA